MAFQTHQWVRDPQNPVLPNGPAEFDATACMNPFVLRRGDEYWMYYAGGNKSGKRHICLAIAKVGNIHEWERKGPLLELGSKGAFDDTWMVLPCVHRIGNTWHLYYTGRSTVGSGLQAFHGIGLAQSEDLIHWRKYSDEPVLRGDGFQQFPGNAGIAGGGRILEVVDDAGDKTYRMYYTLAVGTPSPDRIVDQHKVSVVAHSHDGIHWFDKRIVLERRPEVTYENAAVIALNVWKTKTRWRSIYAGIGTRYAAYSICEAVSYDGLHWERGAPEENLALKPEGAGWESKMVEYPNVIEENGKLRLFYCGNGYGATGIGTALADPLD
jgi:predicted GH43/DUF377 family glycosyl hydrolase